jgi:hypothetical protein
MCGDGAFVVGLGGFSAAFARLSESDAFLSWAPR